MRLPRELVEELKVNPVAAEESRPGRKRTSIGSTWRLALGGRCNRLGHCLGSSFIPSCRAVLRTIHPPLSGDLPASSSPASPTRASKPPVGAQWVHEIKHDGYRFIARKTDDRVRLFTRRGYDWTERYPLIRKAVAAIRTGSAVVDGEAVCCDGAGVAVFEKLHSRAHDDQAFLYAFDLLELNGEDWRPRPLEERKAKLEKLLGKVPPGIQFSEHLEGDGAAIFAHACKLGLEGIVSKHREHAHRSGPAKTWLKVKNPAAPGVLRFEEGE